MVVDGRLYAPTSLPLGKAHRQALNTYEAWWAP